MTDRPDSSAAARPPGGDRLTAAATFIGGLIPDAMTTAIALMAAVVGAALLIGNTFTQIADAYYRGLWMLLPFTMQMTLILVLSSTLAATPFFRRLIVTLSRLPDSPGRTLALAMLTTGTLAYCYWGLSLAMGPAGRGAFCPAVRAQGPPRRFSLPAGRGGRGRRDLAIRLLGQRAAADEYAGAFSGGHDRPDAAVHHDLRARHPGFHSAVFGIELRRSADLAAADAPPDFAISQSMRLGRRRAAGAAETERSADMPEATPAARVEAHRLPTAVLALALVGWLIYHFRVKGGGLELNSLNTTLLLLCLAFHGSVRSFSKALPAAVVTAWPVIVLYHLYAGVAGLIQYTSVGADFASYVASISGEHTFPLFTALSAAAVSIFVPSSGGQWVVQGFITTKAAAAVGVSAQRGLLALSVGDHVGNLVSPFWAVIAAGIARIDFRVYIGYNMIYVVLWFVLGVLCFTFLPC